MAKEPLGSVLHYIRQIAGASASQELTDQELLESFASCRDEAAFAVLVQRHGPLVWGVCRRVLHQAQDAEDAFQATFLVLARKAGRIHWQADVGNWLYTVALRTALKAKSDANRRCGAEGQLQDMPATESNGDFNLREIRPVLDEELNRLPLKYRAPVVLHYFEGKTYAQAAQALGWPAGTVSTRLAQARHLLRGRLARRNITLSTILLAAALSENAAPAMAPAALMDTTVKAAALLAAGQAGAVISTKVVTLTNGVLKTMFLTKLKIGAVLALALGALGAGVGVMGYKWLPTVEAKESTNEHPGGQVADADEPQPDKLKQQIDRLRQENEDLRREVRALRDMLNELVPNEASKERGNERALFQGKPVDHWLKMLKDRDPTYRQKAIEALGAIGAEDKRVIPALVESLKDKVTLVQNAAAGAMAFIGKDAVPTLLELLKGKNSESRKWAAVALSSIGPEAKEAVPALIECLEDEDPNLRSWAAGALGSLAPESKSAIPALIRSLAKEDLGSTQGRTGSTINALSKFGQVAVPALNRALKDPNVKIRASAAGSLALLGSAAKEAIPELILALRDESLLVRQNATSALVILGDDAVPGLVEGLKDKDPVIRAAAAETLGQIGSQKALSTRKAALPALIKAMGDENERVRKAATQAYEIIKTRGQADP
jgi:RNA polymerase sigma factor (sigma-70 family)